MYPTTRHPRRHHHIPRGWYTYTAPLISIFVTLTGCCVVRIRLTNYFQLSLVFISGQKTSVLRLIFESTLGIVCCTLHSSLCISRYGSTLYSTRGSRLGHPSESHAGQSFVSLSVLTLTPMTPGTTQSPLRKGGYGFDSRGAQTSRWSRGAGDKSFPHASPRQKKTEPVLYNRWLHQTYRVSCLLLRRVQR